MFRASRDPLGVGPLVQHTPEPDRVRAATHPEVNQRLDRWAEQRILAAAEDGPESHLRELEQEWDFERVIEAEAASTALVGLTLALTLHRRFVWLPLFAMGMVFVHATHGWYPLLPLLRRMGVRTRDEIERERYALKAVRGDFAGLADRAVQKRAQAAWRAVNL